MAALDLPLPSAEHLAGLADLTLPEAFDARTQWGEQCTTIGAVRNQARCGGCWAFGAVESFTDRRCIACATATASATAAGKPEPEKKKTNCTAESEPMSTEYMIDCDTNDSGCSGGNLDDAWKFIVATGLPTEACYPYRHYPGPPPPPPPRCESERDTNYAPVNKQIMTVGIDSHAECCQKCGGTPGCVLGVYQPPGLCHLKAAADIAGGPVAMPGYVSDRIAPPGPPSPGQDCPARCKDGTAVTTVKARTAYAVGPPGDVAAMQRELMAHGPFEVGFEVFSDFSSYKNGTYARTASATGPIGGHAVKLVGWGTDAASGVPYWTIANSWTADWGDDGFFKIRRGTNECGIEATSAAGLP